MSLFLTRRRGSSLVWILLACLLAFLAWAILYPGFMTHRPQKNLTVCKGTLNNMAKALYMYASDHRGQYPDALSRLTPNYLKTIPVCPAANADTYSLSYQWHNAEPTPEPGTPTPVDTHTPGVDTPSSRFTMYCSGSHHQDVGVPQDYPRYNSEEALVERP
ncbi:MAG: hypothetical protein AB1758_34585 [Candidatus Eremiobacterota bacterium]